jgi:hypothetical protein
MLSGTTCPGRYQALLLAGADALSSLHVEVSRYSDRLGSVVHAVCTFVNVRQASLSKLSIILQQEVGVL